MPLTLRRRPRLPAAEAALPAPASAPAREVAPRPVAGPAEPARVPAAAEASTAPVAAAPRTHARSRRRDRDTWRDRMLGEVFFFLLGLASWLSNAVFTVLGVTAPIGLTVVSGALGFGFHVLLSRAELYLWYRWRDPWYLLLLLGCVLIDVGTTLSGLLPLAAKWLPALVSGTPMQLTQWWQLINAVIVSAPLPAWWPNALVLLLLALAFALGSERLLRKFYRGMAETWQERPAAT